MSKAENLPKYIIRGHGGTNTTSFFTLKNNQYVIFPSKCGIPSSMTTLANTNAVKLLRDPSLIINYKEGRNVKIPIELRNIAIHGPKSRITNSIVEMKNNTRFPNNPARNALHQWYNTTTGVHKLIPSGSEYISGRGNTKRISQIIGNRPGFFWVNACRVIPGTTQNVANNALYRIRTGQPVNIPNQTLKRIAEIERGSSISKRITSRHVFGTKRFRGPNGIRKSKLPPAKRRKIA